MTRPKPRSFLRRLAKDTRGNTLAIVGAALVPLTGMIGSGVDISRAYMAKTRLQAACDAATLAGRRVMTNDEVGTTVRQEAGRFFQFNFPSGVYGSDPIALAAGNPPADGTSADNMFYIWRSAQGTVAGRANTALPTGVMHLFGFETMDIQVDCEASQNFVNTDIVLVLDVTGSMGCSPADTPSACSAYANSNGFTKDGFNYVTEKTDSRMKALREAVLALYDELKPVQDQLEANRMRLRYSIVPYSSGINVGALLDPDHLVEEWDYQSRVPYYAIQNVSQDACKAYDNWSWTRNVAPANVNVGKCTFTSDTEGVGTWNGTYEYEQITHDVSQLKTFASTPVPSRRPGSGETATWRGCIEERGTVSTITASSSYAIPADAHDLNVDLVPTSDATRWRPYWPEVSYHRGGGRPQFACPAPSRRLQSWTRDNLKTYVDALLATGGTHHDNGMIWGARMISDAGVFGDSTNTHNGMPVAKHVIFMTDGVLQTGAAGYTAYGIEYYDKRVTGGWTSNTDQDGRHNRRFTMMCNATKRLGTDRGGAGVSIWVIAFSSTLTDELKSCASSEEQASLSTNKDQLIAKFTEIGKNIGALRLTQ